MLGISIQWFFRFNHWGADHCSLAPFLSGRGVSSALSDGMSEPLPSLAHEQQGSTLQGLTAPEEGRLLRPREELCPSRAMRHR